MEVRVLRYFLAVAREENISAAAQSLNLTQPTLSRQLMDLEEELGKKLFVRGNRKMTLTQDGLFLRKRAAEIVDLVDKTQSDFQGTDELITGEVTIGGGESDAMRLLARTAVALKQAHPQVRFTLSSGNLDDLSDSLEKGLLDFCVLVEPRDLKKFDYIKLPVRDRWGVLMRKDSPLAEQETIHPKDLWDEPLLLSRQYLGKNSLAKWFRRDFGSLDIAATYNLIFNAALMVEEGLGYALTLEHLVDTSGDRPLCFRPIEPALELELYVVWQRFQIFSRAAEAFLALLRETAAEP